MSKLISTLCLYIYSSAYSRCQEEWRVTPMMIKQIKKKENCNSTLYI